MGRDTLLDDAIAKAKEAEDWQLVEWLRMARGGESAARWYSDKLREAHRTERKLLDENAKLRKLAQDTIRAMWACDSDVCVYGGECDEGIEYPRITSCLIERHARELGIEVE